MKSATVNSILMISASFMLACGAPTENNESDNMTSAGNSGAEGMNGKFDIKPGSAVVWTGTMVGMYAHEGSIALKDGFLTLEDGKISGGKFTMDMNTIDAHDNNFDEAKGSTKDKLLGHLKSPDFFDVATFPTAAFEITGSSEGEITGNLTIRGVSQPEKVTEVAYDEATGKWSGTLTFNRKKYNVAWDNPMKEMVVSDEVVLKISLSI